MITGLMLHPLLVFGRKRDRENEYGHSKISVLRSLPTTDLSQEHLVKYGVNLFVVKVCTEFRDKCVPDSTLNYEGKCNVSHYIYLVINN